MPAPVCFKCHTQIAPQTPIASYENRSYHPNCLTCKYCNKSVSGQRFLKDKNQDIICETCDSIHGPVCNKCRKNFKPGQSFKKLDDNTFYHYECFTCFGPCKKSIGAEFYDLDDDKFLCTDCYDKYGARSTYDDIQIIARNDQIALVVPQAIMATKPENDFAQKPNRYEQDDDVNNLSSKFTIKLNETSPDSTSVNLPRDKRSSRFDTSGNKDVPKSLQCEKCGLVIQGSYSVYNEKPYHTKCFVCTKCQKEFKDKSFFKLNNLPVCANCHESNLIATSSRCNKCKNPILDTVLTFMNEEYHESCLTCSLCNGKLIGMSIYTDKQKLPYCVECFTKKEAKKCQKCARPIAPNQTNIIFEEKPYHKECFTCGTCRRAISADESFFKGADENIICEECANI